MSDINFFQIGALKVFAELGALIEEDSQKEIKFMNLPIDIIQNNILNHLKTDKTINKIFYDKDDYYLQNLLSGKLEKMDYIKTDEWNEFKTDLNLDPIKEYININHKCFMKQFNTKNKFNCTSIIIKYRVPSNFKLNLILINIKVYENDKYIGSIDLKNLFNTNLCDKELELLKNEIKEYVNQYNQN
jgi:hypothetical protein